MNTLINTSDLCTQTDVFCSLLDQSLFYEAHEALEALWFEHRFEKCDEIRLVRAYINAAVSFELIKRGRPKAALKPWGFFQKHFELIQKVPQVHQVFYELIYKKIFETSKKIS
ncbi:MAG: DUF309 domain-containing protein [Thiovulaceae bacterium]|nr:DUF309 domain-containing protein [Sulfurimonadaceae bacterium]